MLWFAALSLCRKIITASVETLFIAKGHVCFMPITILLCLFIAWLKPYVHAVYLSDICVLYMNCARVVIVIWNHHLGQVYVFLLNFPSLNNKRQRALFFMISSNARSNGAKGRSRRTAGTRLLIRLRVSKVQKRYSWGLFSKGITFFRLGWSWRHCSWSQ